MGWPRIPLPGWPDGDAPGAADELRTSAERGRDLATLLDSEAPVAGVTAGTLRPELAAIAVPSTADGRNMSGDDFALTTGWGHFGTGDAVMPGTGRAAERDYTTAERQALGEDVGVLGDATVDVYLNDTPGGATFPPPCGTINWAATRSSKSGCPTGKARFWAATCCRRRCSTSPTPRGASRRCWGW